jgi:hypothetical protein
MATDPLDRYAASGTALVTVSLVLAMGCMTLASGASTGLKNPPISPILFATAALSIGTAYWYRLRWPFLLGLLCLFHAVGSGHFYGGRGSYFFSIQDPRVMAPVAAFVMILGVMHERLEEHRLAPWSGFGRLCVIFGLLYFNCSLWIPSIKHSWSGADQSLPWVIAFTATTIGEIVLGARLADSKFTGFGVVFLSINLYTRLFENFWDKLSMGLFFLAAGLVGLTLGVLFEFLGRQR